MLNPNVDTKHQLVQSLRDQGHALLLASNAIEAWQILELHGASVELAVVHREGHGGQSEEGLEFVFFVGQSDREKDCHRVDYVDVTTFWNNMD